jgi:hypothetical protein
MRLADLLSVPGLVRKAPLPAVLLERGRRERPLEVFYGETFDLAGNPVDCLKYYLFTAELADSLREEGVAVHPVVLVADSAILRTAPERQRASYEAAAASRLSFVRRVNEVYRCGLDVRLMSDFLESPGFVERRERVMRTVRASPSLQTLLEATVPAPLLEEERRGGFLYSFDELTTIVSLDAKVGPPREDLYDRLARELAVVERSLPLMSAYLSPTYPLGKNWAYFCVNEELERYGITAYKAATSGLEAHRVLIGRTSGEEAGGLIQASFTPSDSSLPNPVADLSLIVEMAQSRLLPGSVRLGASAQSFYRGEVDASELQVRVTAALSEFVLEPLAGGLRDG